MFQKLIEIRQVKSLFSIMFCGSLQRLPKLYEAFDFWVYNKHSFGGDKKNFTSV